MTMKELLGLRGIPMDTFLHRGTQLLPFMDPLNDGGGWKLFCLRIGRGRWPVGLLFPDVAAGSFDRLPCQPVIRQNRGPFIPDEDPNRPALLLNLTEPASP